MLKSRSELFTVCNLDCCRMYTLWLDLHLYLQLNTCSAFFKINIYRPGCQAGWHVTLEATGADRVTFCMVISVSLTSITQYYCYHMYVLFLSPSLMSVFAGLWLITISNTHNNHHHWLLLSTPTLASLTKIKWNSVQSSNISPARFLSS